MANLQDKISDLISRNKEGEFWDFKLEHHDNRVNLVLDIICLANTVRHQGPRYLIFGVDPDSYEIIGLQNASPRKKQADIIDTLRNARFSNQNFPDIELVTLKISNKEIDVIIIQDKKNKPYYLEQDYLFKGQMIRAGVIYSRIQDTNTPKDRTATPSDIEKMWREHFGLDLTPMECLAKFLKDPDGWEDVEETKWYYKKFPEYTISDNTSDTGELIEVRGGENWVRAAINPRAFVCPISFRYHQTILKKVTCIYYDEFRELISAPRPECGSGINRKNWFFYLIKDELDFCFIEFLYKKRKCCIENDHIYSARIGNMPILIFETQKEKEAFLLYLASQEVVPKKRHRFVGIDNDPLVTEQDKHIIEYSRAVIDMYNIWKKRQQTLLLGAEG